MAGALTQAAGGQVYPESLLAEGGALFALARQDAERRLLILWPARKDGGRAVTRHFKGQTGEADLAVGQVGLLDVPVGPPAAAALRKTFPWTAPQAVAGRPSIGLGDRLGLATPGHVRAVRGTLYVPMLAQQSIREMSRTQRSPQDVLDDATWGVFQTGFRTGYGADADHLKNTEDIDRCAAAGFTYFTVDPGDHVDNTAAANLDILAPDALADKFDALPWQALETTAADTRREYAARRVDLGGAEPLAFTEVVLHRAGAKYGRAVAHVAAMYRHLVRRLGEGKFELEISVDETDAPTTAAEHFYVARELHRMGVRWVSLAPRFVGRFEKGVDYVGDLAELERTFQAHLAVAERFGDYKLSLHSGSDKFSVYEMAARHGGRRVHVKTAGTSYLEALRVVAANESALFREILDFARCRYETDKATYHVSANLHRVPVACVLADWQLAGVLDAFDGRQVLHVTFGSVLTAGEGKRFRARLLDALRQHEEAYAEALAKHIGRHVAPFVK
ncbi:MAG: hypothetical protein FJ288_14310 [Planctomycetes bacterium]|nr:hypothetical protein [Planctomycetota bacterium]